MTTREALQALAERGVEITYWRLRGAIDRGEIPRPRLSTSLRWDWTEADVDRAAALLQRKSEAVAR